MAGSAGHLPPGGRSRGRSRTKLPPIPERSLSSQRASGAVVRNRGAASRDRFGRGIIMPESRRSARRAIAEVESRDDDDDPAAAVAVASSDASHNPNKPLNELVFQVESELGLPPPPPAVSYMPVQTESASFTSRNSRKSATSRNSTTLSVPPVPSDTITAPVNSDSASNTSRNYQRLQESYALAISDGAVESTTAAPESRIVVEQTPSVMHAASFKTQASRIYPEPKNFSKDNRFDATTTNKLLCEPDFDPPEIMTIPTDEMMDSLRKEPQNNHNSSSSDENMMDNMSRETRDQYQMGRLQARINQRQQIRSPTTEEEFAPNYKTLRSSRIKTARSLINQRGNSPENTSSTPDLANRTSSSTFHSLNCGHAIGCSNTSSSSGIRSASNSDLSVQRGKLFEKMICLLNDVSSNIKPDDVSAIKEMLMDDISAPRSSIAELKLIQEHPEDEMSRILNEFEQNNSLIEKKDSVPCIPEFGIPEFPQFGVPEFTYQNNATAIATKFSDVTNPNCHDGFEEDEIMIHPDYLSRRGSGRLHRTELLSPPSPVAAAAAATAISVAASFPLRSMIKKPEFSLASAHDIPDKIELEDDNDDGAQNGRIGQSFVAVYDAEIEDEKEVSSVAHVVEEELMVKHSKCPQDNTAEHCGLSRRKMKVRGAKKEHFHDDILRAVSMLSASPMHGSEELLEVTSILSQYEEAGKKAKDNHMKANEELMEAKRKNPDEDESGAPLDEKLNQQMWGCATWLCVQ